MTPVEQSPAFALAHPELQQQQAPPGDEDGEDEGGDEEDGGSEPPPKGKQARRWALAAFEEAAGSPGFRFEFTAAWSDVVAKANRILKEDGVRITMLARSMTVGEVKGDHATYETGLQYYPGRGFSVMAYSCGCPWASFHQDPDYPSRFAGRMCSHAYALSLAAKARGVVRRTMFPDLSGWPEEVVTKSWPPWNPSDREWAETWKAPMTRRPIMGSRGADGYGPPAVTAARVLLGAGEDPAAVTVLLSCAGLRITADQANAPWGSQDVVDMPPQKPYGATSPPEKDRDPGSYGFLAGPDPDNWGEIQDNSAITMPLTNEAAKQSEDRLVPDAPDTSDWAEEGQSLAYQDPDARIIDTARRFGKARQDTGQVTNSATMHIDTGPGASCERQFVDERQEGFPYPSQGPAAGPSAPISARDPQGIRFEEALLAARRAFTAAMKRTAQPELEPQRQRQPKQVLTLERPRTDLASMTEFEHDLSHGGGGFPPIGGGMEEGGGGGEGGDPQHFLIIRNQPGHFGLINNVSEDHSQRYTSYHHSAAEAIHMLAHLERGGHYQPHELDYVPNAKGTRVHDIGDQYLAHANRWFNEGHPDYNPHPDVPPTPRTEQELDEHWRSYHSATAMGVGGARDDAHRFQLKSKMHDLHHGNTRMAPEFHLCPNKHNARWDRSPGWDRCEFESTGHTHMPPGLEDLFGHGEEEFMAGEGQGPTKYSSLAEPQEEGALAELKDEPEGALDPEGLTAEENPEESSRSAWGNRHSGTYTQVPGIYNPGSTDTALTPGSGDEPMAPEDSSIQTMGNQQWSGGDYNSGDLAVSTQHQEHPAENPDEADIVRQFQASAAGRQYSGDGSIQADGDIAAAARAYLSKTADVLPAEEADELIREGRGSRARNLDLLDLKGTHYTDDPGLEDHDDDILYA